MPLGHANALPGRRQTAHPIVKGPDSRAIEDHRPVSLRLRARAIALKVNSRAAPIPVTYFTGCKNFVGEPG
jgi:hypothetical protein